MNLQETCIIRRTDDFGRVVIPREIRKTLGIREGEPMMILIDRETKTVGFQVVPEEYDTRSILKSALWQIGAISTEREIEIEKLLKENHFI